MDRKLAMVCAHKLANTFNLILLEKENIDSSVSLLSDSDKIALIQSIFSMEKGGGAIELGRANPSPFFSHGL